MMTEKHMGHLIVYPDGRIYSKLRRRFLKGAINSDGYVHTSLFGKYQKVHRIIAQCFIPNPDNKLEVNHKNGIKHDNRIENLEWATHSENTKHAFVTGLNPPNRGSKNGFSKLTEDKVMWIRDQIEKGRTMTSISIELSVTIQTIWKIKKGISWTHCK